MNGITLDEAGLDSLRVGNRFSCAVRRPYSLTGTVNMKLTLTLHSLREDFDGDGDLGAHVNNLDHDPDPHAAPAPATPLDCLGANEYKSSQGQADLFYLNNTGTKFDPAFVRNDSVVASFSIGVGASPSCVDFDGDVRRAHTIHLSDSPCIL